VSFFSVIQARKMYRGEFPKPARTTPPNTNYYYLSDLRAWKRTHPGLFKGTKPKAG
jgi:predicted DNA-binding transcriptional regulator AlpA